MSLYQKIRKVFVAKISRYCPEERQAVESDSYFSLLLRTTGLSGIQSLLADEKPPIKHASNWPCRLDIDIKQLTTEV